MNLDQEIRGVEERIARERNGLALLAEDWAGAARDAVVSRKSLFAVAAFGFVLGDALRPRRPVGRARKLGLGGMLAGIAFAAPAGAFRVAMGARRGRLARLADRDGATRGARCTGGTDARTGRPSSPRRAPLPE